MEMDKIIAFFSLENELVKTLKKVFENVFDDTNLKFLSENDSLLNCFSLI